MRQALRNNRARQATGRGASIPAPVGGWDASSALADMKPHFAVQLDNLDPEPGYVRIRRGHLEHATGVGAGAVETLMAYHGVTDASDALIAASDDTLWDVTAASAATSAVTGLTNGRWQHVNFTTSGGKFLVCVNGADLMQAYSGSAWSEPSITGTTSDNFIHVAAHKKRLWFVLKESTKAAYLPVDSIAGASVTFDLGAVFTRGGFLMAIGSWTLDAGVGVDDHAVFVSSEGQVAIYKGTDPASASTWSLVGVYDVGPPLGRRCLLKVAGDLAIVSQDGILPMSQAIQYDRGASDRVAITARIQNAMNEVARDFGSNHGWQLTAYPRGTKAILNVPTAEGVSSQQYVMNVLTGAWCRYTGINAFCWEVFQGRLFFGGAGGVVFEADRGAMDNGAAIRARCVTAFNYFGSRGSLKQFTMVQPLIVSDGRVTPAIEVDVDFKVGAPIATVSEITNVGTNWGEGVWGEFMWASSTISVSDWISVSGIGQCAAVDMVLTVAVPEISAGQPITLQVNGFNLMFKPGGIL